MNIDELVNERVTDYFCTQDLNCAITTLKILSEVYSIEINKQVLDSATGLNGLGLYGAQCGLITGVVMFLGILGKTREKSDDDISEICNRLASEFESKMGSLQCKILRPEGFKPENPPDLCKPLALKALELDIDFITRLLKTGF